MANAIWGGQHTCDICGIEIQDELFDGKTTHGPWATMCNACFKTYGVGVGTGKGQKYSKDDYGQFVKVESEDRDFHHELKDTGNSIVVEYWYGGNDNIRKREEFSYNPEDLFDKSVAQEEANSFIERKTTVVYKEVESKDMSDDEIREQIKKRRKLYDGWRKDHPKIAREVDETLYKLDSTISEAQRNLGVKSETFKKMFELRVKLTKLYR